MTAPQIEVFVEAGQQKVFAGALAWPGWCRSARDEASALAALLTYAPRYVSLLSRSPLAFALPDDPAAFAVVERVAGTNATDFGVAAVELAHDTAPFDEPERARSELVLTAIWDGFDRAVEAAAGRELRKGPRGGGRDRDKIVQHILQADQGYLHSLGQRVRPEEAAPLPVRVEQTRDAVRAALHLAARGELPEQGPRGGKIWPPRYFVRRLAWHTADHLWEIEDRMM